MWIYYYAMFGPGHQSNDYGFKHYPDDLEAEDIKENLLRIIDKNSNVVLRFWKVERPPAKYVEYEIKDIKDSIKGFKKHLKMLKETSCFVPDEKEEKDVTLIKNIGRCVMDCLLRRLHKAGFMYGAEDINNWEYGKKRLLEPKRSKILSIMRKTEKYPDYSK